MDRRLRRRRYTRRDFLVTSAGAGAGLVLTSCLGGSSQTTPTTTGGGEASADYNGPNVSLAFWNGFTGGDGPYMQKLIDEFGNEFDNIDVQMNTVEWADYYQRSLSSWHRERVLTSASCTSTPSRPTRPVR